MKGRVEIEVLSSGERNIHEGSIYIHNTTNLQFYYDIWNKYEKIGEPPIVTLGSKKIVGIIKKIEKTEAVTTFDMRGLVQDIHTSRTNNPKTNISGINYGQLNCNLRNANKYVNIFIVSHGEQSSQYFSLEEVGGLNSVLFYEADIGTCAMTGNGAIRMMRVCASDTMVNYNKKNIVCSVSNPHTLDYTLYNNAFDTE